MTLPAPPAPPSFRLSNLFSLRPAARRWPFALRAGICMAAPVLAGWLAGNIPMGMMATIGGFTALYGSGRPYVNRVRHLAVVVLAFAVTVALGVGVAESPALVVPVVVAIAMVATFLCNALRVGPPGAYMFTLACAAGTALPVGDLDPLRIGLLVLAGGAFAWLAHMVGALFAFRAPERAAVRAAATAVARFAEAAGSTREDDARHAAALAMRDSWTSLVIHQPVQPRPDGVLSHLRAINRELNLVLVDIINAPTDDDIRTALAARAHVLEAEAAGATRRRDRTDPGHVPLGHTGLIGTLRESMKPWSPAVMAAARVGVAAALAGLIGAAFELERAYWAMAAAVLILHQGLDWMRALQRGIERMLGTMVGLILAGAILMIDLQGLWLVLAIGLVSFTIEMTVIRNYALAVVFITSAALTIAAGGYPVGDVGHLLWVRGSDTVIGCVIALAVLAATSPRVVAVRIPQELVRTLDTLQNVLGLLARGDPRSGPARLAHRDLQQRTIALLQSYDAAIGSATPLQRDLAERSWPAVVAAQRLAYRVLATCWSLAEMEEDEAGAAIRDLLGHDGEGRVSRALVLLQEAVRDGTRPVALPLLPEFLNTEMQSLHASISRLATEQAS